MTLPEGPRGSLSGWMSDGRTETLTYLVGDVVDCDVMHGRSVALEQSVKVSPTVPATGGKNNKAPFLHFSAHI